MSSFNRLEHIPCATLLVRIRLASKVDGKTVGVKEIPPNE